LDGPVYAASGTTTSREVSQISMLKGFGWNIVRIWSLEWWENPDNVFDKLVSLIAEAKEPADAGASEPAEEVTEAPGESSGPDITVYGQEQEQPDGEAAETEEQAQKKTLT